MPNAKRKRTVPKEDLAMLDRALLGRKTAGRSRVGAMLGAYMDAKPAGAAKATKAQAAAPRIASVPEGRKKARATWDLPADLLEECRDAVVFLAGPPCHHTMASLVEEALRRELARLKREHRKGQDFPKRAAAVRMGRPVR